MVVVLFMIGGINIGSVQFVHLLMSNYSFVVCVLGVI